MSLVRGWMFSDRFRTVFEPVISSWWNNQWRRSTITYTIRPGYRVDVRRVFDSTPKEEAELKKLVFDICYKDSTNDEKAFTIFKWVKDNIRYEYDDASHNTPEYWQTAYETYKRNRGDCEDSHILQMKLCQLAGIPAYRRKLCTGWVRCPNNEGRAGHAYMIYLRESDNNWYVLDSVYWPDKSELGWKKEIPHKLMTTDYLDVWWTTNEEYSFAQHDMTIGKNLVGNR